MTLTAAQNRLFARFESLGIPAITHHHAPVHTVEEARAHRGDIPGAHCKNLFLKDKKTALWLIVAKEDARIDLKNAAGIIGSARLSFGNDGLLMSVLGVTPGSVTPYAAINDRDQTVTIVLDSAMMREALLNFHPLANTATTSITPSDLVKFIESCGHKPHIVAISA